MNLKGHWKLSHSNNSRTELSIMYTQEDQNIALLMTL